ncbi:sugar transferase [Streptomyces sp. NPDC046876]|uniref:sugar transferase n=1 Tax=Streptomyces sp. NPDC046876 TaxID=3155616 RepID=UPI003410E52C
MPLPPLPLPPVRRPARRPGPRRRLPLQLPRPQRPLRLLRLPRLPDCSAKRVVDLAGAVALLGALLLPLLALAALLYAVQGGRALDRAPAAGLGGRPFRTWRLHADPAGPVGRAVRRWALDGLPQLLNVLRGEMSLVGPRPQNRTDRPDRLFVRPGMTGLWQVSARSDLPWEEMALLDRHYVESHWLGMDLAILAQTPRAARTHRHA